MPKPISAFQKAIDAVESLSLQDQEAVLTLLQKRIADQRRQELSQSVAQVRHEFAQGNVQFGSVDNFMAGLDY
ncbi:hypothetical protein [Nodosilinea sp. FACHB-13]|uniref:hypothetical protein n=1 Tax=Cyanophyceae TaxID=3028117 RepID=UPI001689800E|nr:hypothetical protein [Nodosilinea sp. FACHB-13]MBD2109546.1 hypothetical protein [Nodosilinea sp. FACHB-13]